MSDYDVVVIGGGPGGYAAAIRAAQLRKRTACVEARPRLGGTCLNVGCIPSKALLASSWAFEETRSGLTQHGIHVEGASIDVPAMMARKEKIVDDLAKGIDFLLKKNGVERIEGWATVPSQGCVKVEAGEGERVLSAEAIILATGSSPMMIPGIDIDEHRIVTSTGALSLETVPKRMIVVGAGVIGLELGQVWSRLGAEVTVVEYLDRVLPGIDAEIAKTAQRLLSRRALRFVFGHKVLGAERLNDSVSLLVEKRADGSQQRLEAEVVLLAIGRRPAVDGVVDETIRLECDSRGFVVVDPAFRTSCPGLYAIGDCVVGPMLAHKAEHDAIGCVEAIAGVVTKNHSAHVPSVVYTHPEIASVGQSEDELRLAGADIAVGKFHFMANSRARVSDEADGLVKVLADRGTGRIVGAHIIGAHAGELISEFVVAMARQSTLEDIASACHPHPSFGEACKEACLAALGRALHA